MPKPPKPCNGCGGPKEKRERAHFCVKCAASPLVRPLMREKKCRKGHILNPENILLYGQRWKCRTCEEARPKKRWTNPVNRTASQNAGKQYRLKKDFGLTVEEWLQMYDSQGGLCFICGKKLRRWLEGTGIIAAVDHCHRTGLIRGLLCRFPCNYYLGRFRDNPILLRRCAEYVENPPAITAFGKGKYTAPGKVGTKKRIKLLVKF